MSNSIGSIHESFQLNIPKRKQTKESCNCFKVARTNSIRNSYNLKSETMKDFQRRRLQQQQLHLQDEEEGTNAQQLRVDGRADNSATQCPICGLPNVLVPNAGGVCLGVLGLHLSSNFLTTLHKDLAWPEPGLSMPTSIKERAMMGQ